MVAIGHVSRKTAAKPALPPILSQPLAKPEPTDRSRAIGHAAALISKKRFGEALAILFDLLSENIEDKHAIFLAMKALTKAGSVRAAQTLFENAAECGLAEPRAYALMVSILCGNGMANRAKTVFEDAMRIHPDSASFLHTAIIRSMAPRHRIGDATKYFNDARRRGIADHETYVAMMSAHSYCRDFKSARAVFDLALRDGEYDQSIFCAMIKIYGRNGRNRLAEGVLDIAQRTGCADPIVYQYMMEMHREAGEFTEAIKVFDSAIAAGKLEPGICIKGMSTLYRLKHFREIITFADSLPYCLRTDPEIRLIKAEALRKLSAYDEAIIGIDLLLMEPGLEQGTRDRAMVIKGYAVKDNGRPDEAFSLFEKLLAGLPSKSIHFPRSACGLVFSWHELGCDGRLSRECRAALLDQLEKSRCSATCSMQGKIERAIRILRNNPDPATVQSVL
jgi:tetratricopeptide (TPR) repeat protein